jgi:hypothetical protein
MKVKAECGSCDGTGLYCGFAEPKGTAVICLNCGGTGCDEIGYIRFTGRKERRDVHTVKRSAGSFIFTGVGPVGKSVTYEEFCRGKMPKA